MTACSQTIAMGICGTAAITGARQLAPARSGIAGRSLHRIVTRARSSVQLRIMRGLCGDHPTTLQEHRSVQAVGQRHRRSQRKGSRTNL